VSHFAYSAPAFRRTPTAGLALSRRAARALGQAMLIALMGLGSVVLWVGSPVIWLWLASRLARTPEPTFAMCLFVLAGVIGTAVVMTRGLRRLDLAYRRITRTPERRLRDAWLRATDRELREPCDSGVLGSVMAVSVIAAVAVLAVSVAVSGQPLVPLPL
jgi:hypothetical protein